MRCIIVALLFGALVYPKNVEALDCGTTWALPGWWQRAANSGNVSAEQQRRDAESRATLDLLERTPIVFRGRVASVRYLTGLLKVDTAINMIAFDHVEVLKGRLAATSSDRKAFILEERWCDGSCSSGAAIAKWPLGETVLVGVHPDEFEKAPQSFSKRLNYKGRIDAVLGMCQPGRLTPTALELLNASDDETTRLKRDYQPRRLN
jgi:hypothetical protein